MILLDTKTLEDSLNRLVDEVYAIAHELKKKRKFKRANRIELMAAELSDAERAFLRSLKSRNLYEILQNYG